MTIPSLYWSAFAAAFVGASAPVYVCAETVGQDITIAAVPVAVALRILARQTGRNIVYDDAIVRGRMTRPVQRAANAEVALARMLLGTGLTFQKRTNGTLIVLASPKPREPRGPPTRQAQVSQRAEPAPVSANIVVVGSYIRAMSAAAERKRRSMQVIDSLSAEDVGKFPARNLGEAMLRIPGVTVDRVAPGARGQAVYVNIRGLPAAFQSVQFNGRDIASNENVENSAQYGRSFRFDILPPDIVSAVDIAKTADAATTEGAIAASINLHTYRPLDLGNVTTVSLKGLRNDLANAPGVSVTAMKSWVSADRTWGLVLAASYTDQHDREDRLYASAFTLGSAASNTANRTPQFANVYLPSSVRVTLENYYGKRATVVGAAQFRPSDALETTIDVLYTSQTNRYSQPGLLFDLAGSTIDPTTAVIRNGVLVAGRSSAMNISVVNERSTQRQELLSTGINQRWHKGDWTITADFNHSKADSYTPKPIERVQYSISAPASFDFSGGLDAMPTLSTSLNLLNSSAGYTGSGVMLARMIRVKTKLDVARIDVDHTSGGLVTDLAAGLSLERRTRSYWRIDRTASGFIGASASGDSFEALGQSNVFRDITGSFPRNWLVPNLDALFAQYFDFSSLSSAQTAADLAASSYLRENMLSGYAMASFSVPMAGLTLEGNTGLRVAYTNQLTRGHAVSSDAAVAIAVDAVHDYTEVLPSLNVRTQLTKDLLLRLGIARSMTRPQPDLLAPGMTITLQSGTGVGGNPNLKPFLATNYDASLEWYFNRSGHVSVAGFRKDFDNYLTEQVTQITSIANNFGYTSYSITTQTNGGSAHLTGLELAYQQKFAFLPGVLSGLGVELAYTRVFQDSQFAVLANGVTTLVKDKMLGVSPNSYSLICVYEQGGLSARLGYDWRDAYLVSAGGSTQTDTFFDAFGSLDASLGYALGPHASLTLTGVNLLRASMRQYGLTHSGQKVPGEYYAYGRTLTMGVQMKF